jgi:hypothetical protein
VQSRLLRRGEQRSRLLEHQRLRRTALLPVRSIDRRRNIPAHEILSLGMPDHPRQAIVRLLHCPRGVRARHLVQRHADIVSGQIVQRDRADAG